jgi:mitogen-activated protein kinase 1/3
MNNFYSYSIDIWSVGCIFAELFSMMKENFENFTDRTPLFPGSSCYKLSPSNGEKLNEDKAKQKDQLFKIFQVIGTPKPEDDLSTFLEQKESQDYVRSFPSMERVNLEDLYPASDPRGIALIYRMLEFNPNKRITAEQAIMDPYFDDIRIEEQEHYPPPKIDLSIDDLGR